jgi:hypothetical protein
VASGDAAGEPVVTRIERFASRADAELARAVLEANGIPAYVSGDDAGGLHPEIPYGIGGTAVVVPEDRYADAIALLDDEFTEEEVTAAELEAAALAAGSGEPPSGDPVTGDAAPSPALTATTATTGEPDTRRSGRGRPAFVVVVAVMLGVILLTAFLVSALDLWIW